MKSRQTTNAGVDIGPPEALLSSIELISTKIFPSMYEMAHPSASSKLMISLNGLMSVNIDSSSVFYFCIFIYSTPSIFLVNRVCFIKVTLFATIGIIL